MLVPNAYGFMVSVWLNMAAVKLQYSNRMAASLRLSFVQLLDSNRKSFRGLDRRETSRMRPSVSGVIMRPFKPSPIYEKWPWR